MTFGHDLVRVVVAALLVAVVGLVSVLPYRLTRFEYVILERDGQLLVIMHWCQLVRIRKKVRLSAIESVRRLRSLLEIAPLIRGFPRLWGKWHPDRMVILKIRRTFGLATLALTPDDPEAFVASVSRATSAGKSS
jgi:hypothetical protein